MQELEIYKQKKEHLICLFQNLLSRFPEKKYYVEKAISFMHSYDDNRMFFRNFFSDGHFTAGILIFNLNKDKILLLHHIKSGKWHHFGGHADGEIDLFEVALRELEEEGGIFLNKNTVKEEIINLDIHVFPKKGDEPEHLHYDVNFLGFVSSDISFQKQETEVHDIQWFPVTQLQDMAQNEQLPSGLILSLRNLKLIS